MASPARDSDQQEFNAATDLFPEQARDLTV